MRSNSINKRGAKQNEITNSNIVMLSRFKSQPIQKNSKKITEKEDK